MIWNLGTMTEEFTTDRGWVYTFEVEADAKEKAAIMRRDTWMGGDDCEDRILIKETANGWEVWQA